MDVFSLSAPSAVGSCPSLLFSCFDKLLSPLSFLPTLVAFTSHLLPFAPFLPLILLLRVIVRMKHYKESTWFTVLQCPGVGLLEFKDPPFFRTPATLFHSLCQHLKAKITCMMALLIFFPPIYQSFPKVWCVVP